MEVRNFIAPVWSTVLFLLVASFGTKLVSADYNCWTYDGVCDFWSSSGTALYQFWSRHDNFYEDRIWTIRNKAVPFWTDNDYSTDYVNGWSQAFTWESSTQYMRGWYSYHANSEEDRRFKIRYSDLADGYTRGDCQWSGTNAYDGEYTFTRGSNYYAFGIKSTNDDFPKTERSHFCFALSMRRHHRRHHHHRREATVCRRLLLACKRYK